ncbi:GAF domain-containing sensor histidine kinase [Polycladidibacter hongkongensis]|uniref:GAF domain-containing sensor histidine kinase n=1 Tax=Polycladidibacter hongkongensis TaxID=1647556 RepID=UPI00082ED427|nr:ATP-binding protein [Pseudovibrio hongkongensis]
MSNAQDTTGMTASLFFNIVRAIAGRVGFQSVISAVSSEIQRILPHDHFDAVILDGDQTRLVAYESGLHTDWGGVNKLVSTSPIRSLLRGEVDYLITDNAQEDPRFLVEGMFNEPIFSADLKGRIHVPLRVAGEMIGALSLSNKIAGTYQQVDIENAILVADIIGPYFYALRQSDLVRRAELAREKEKARLEGLRTGARYLTEELERARAQIGMDLHDQTLADLSRLSRSLADADVLKGKRLEQVRRDIQHCLTELRIIIDDAKPTFLELFGLPEAVSFQLDRARAMVPGVFHCDVRDETEGKTDELPLTIRLTIYRVLQEAINNALKHSGGDIICISFENKSGRLRVSVRDNGAGLEEDSEFSQGGMHNMRTRAALIGAEFDVKRCPRLGGTLIALEVQMKEAGAQ